MTIKKLSYKKHDTAWTADTPFGIMLIMKTNAGYYWCFNNSNVNCGTEKKLADAKAAAFDWYSGKIKECLDEV